VVPSSSLLPDVLLHPPLTPASPLLLLLSALLLLPSALLLSLLPSLSLLLVLLAAGAVCTLADCFKACGCSSQAGAGHIAASSGAFQSTATSTWSSCRQQWGQETIALRLPYCTWAGGSA
jgi:hypothetical protein